MKRHIFKMLLVGMVISTMLVGCGKEKKADTDAENATVEWSEVFEENTENMGVTYTVNENGRYICDDKVYDYKMVLDNKEKDLPTKIQFVVLTNNRDLTFRDVYLTKTRDLDGAEFVILGWSSDVKEEGSRKRDIQLKLTDSGTLRFSGSGKLKNKHHCYLSKSRRAAVKKIVLSEGITELEEGVLAGFPVVEKIELPNSLVRIEKEAFCGCDSLEKIELPNSITRIEEEAFRGCDSLQTISFCDGVTEIGAYAFSACDSLENIVIPDSVTTIEGWAFSDCKNLKKIVLPKSLQVWDETVTEGCRELNTVVNRSKISCELYDDNGCWIWKVAGKKVKAVPKGTTAKGEGMRIPITYNLLGGVQSGYLPKTFQFGEYLEVPLNVKKDGYEALSWHWKGKYSFLNVRFGVGPYAKKATLTPNWFKYKITNCAPGTVRVKIRHYYKYRYMEYKIRYSESEDMKHAKKAWIRDTFETDTVEIKGLERGKTYYFEFTGYIDADSGAEPWMGKRKITIKE